MAALEWLGGIAVMIGAVTVLACPTTIAWQAYFWLRWGYWLPLSVRDAWYWLTASYDPTTTWAGMDDLIGWVFEAPLSIASLIAGIFLVMLGSRMESSGKS